MPRSSIQAVNHFDGHDLADGDGARHPREQLRLGNGLERGLKRCDHQTRRAVAREPPEHAHSPPEDFVDGGQLARRLFPGGEDLGHDAGERRHVVAEVVDVADVREHDDERRGRMQSQGRRGESRR